MVIGGTRIFRRRRSLLTDPEFAETPFLPGMIVMLGLAALASYIGLAAIIGAFLAGMVVGESSERHAPESEVAPVAGFFTLFFFGFIGAQIDLAGLADVQAVLLLLGITGLAIATKFLGAFLGAIREGATRATSIGWGMVPRGEVGIVVAGLGLSQGAIGGEIYTVVVGMASSPPSSCRRCCRCWSGVRSARMRQRSRLHLRTAPRPTPGRTDARGLGTCQRERPSPPRRRGASLVGMTGSVYSPPGVTSTTGFSQSSPVASSSPSRAASVRSVRKEPSAGSSVRISPAVAVSTVCANASWSRTPMPSGTARSAR